MYKGKIAVAESILQLINLKPTDLSQDDLYKILYPKSLRKYSHSVQLIKWLWKSAKIHPTQKLPSRRFKTNLLQLALESKEYEPFRLMLTTSDLKDIPSNLIGVSINQGALTVVEDLIIAGCELSINPEVLLGAIKNKDHATIVWLLEKKIYNNSIELWYKAFIDGDITIINIFLEYGFKLPSYNLKNYRDFMHNYAALYLESAKDLSSDFKSETLLWKAYPLLEICAVALSTANISLLNYLVKNYSKLMRKILRDHLPQFFLSQKYDYLVAFNSSIDWIINQNISFTLPDWQGKTLLERIFIHSYYPLTFYLRLIAEVDKINPLLKYPMIKRTRR